MQSWALTELDQAALGDVRRTRRLAQLLDALSAQPSASVCQACGSWAASKAAYRFWDNAHICADAIRASHTHATCARLNALDCVLAVQDTTELDFFHHPATTGLGPLSAPSHHGLHVHSTLAVSTAGVPLGLLDQQVWTRDPASHGKRHQRRKRPTADKESQRWLDALTASLAVLPEQLQVVTVADSEADIYDLFALPRRTGAELLIRATHNRRCDHQAAYLWDAVRQSPLQTRDQVRIPRAPQRAERSTTLEIRWLATAILPPRNQVGRNARYAVPLTALLVEEVTPPPGQKAICWLLLTTLPVPDVATARRLVQWYRYRWLIERYHYVLKSGCRIEELQLETAERLQRALATYAIVAWRLLWLTYQARQQPEQSCGEVLSQSEWQALTATMQPGQPLPDQPPSLSQAVRWIAQLGGFLARRGDGEPGAQTIWKGLRRLHDIAATWQLSHPPSFQTAPRSG